MSEVTGNLIIAGQDIFAGIDEEDVTKIPLAIVIEFKDKESLKKAMKKQKVEFTVFEPDNETCD